MAVTMAEKRRPFASATVTLLLIASDVSHEVTAAEDRQAAASNRPLRRTFGRRHAGAILSIGSHMENVATIEVPSSRRIVLRNRAALSRLNV